MRVSQYLLATLKEIPADSEVVSHQLMLRAGMIRKLAAGIYNWLPLGLKVLRKIETIIREEMAHAGAIEILMPSVQPAELWQESSRWETFIPPLLRMKDRHQREFCFGPTHEEVITDMMRREINSYKQLPLTFFQIQTKFRDELRPRSGVLRAREFIMKDAYSFNLDERSLQQSYDQMFVAYSRIFARLGLNYRAVLADTGAIGGIASHEFQVLAESGEDRIAISDTSDYAANTEMAETLPCRADHTQAGSAPKAPIEKLYTPHVQSIEAVSKLLNIHPGKMIKTLIVKGTHDPFVALVLRGDHELNKVKAEKLTQVAAPLTFASREEIYAAIGCKAGYLGPINLDLPIIVDHSAAQLVDFVCGANENDYHLCNVNWERDANRPKTADLRIAVAGDPSPDGQGTLKIVRGIEAGHIFQLGTKYSEALGAKVLNEKGQEVPIQMGCYGLGVSRIIAACIEQNHDDRGIIWPEAMAPFTIALVPIAMRKSNRLRDACERLYQQLTELGYEVLFDDRDERPGVKFADMDLIGIPHRLVLSEHSLASGEHGHIEYKFRRDSKSQNIDLSQLIDFLDKHIKIST